MKTGYYLVITNLLFSYCQTVTIREEGGLIQKFPGERLQLTCSVLEDGYDGTNKNIQWKKTQDTEENAANEMMISHDGALSTGTPFYLTGRFSVHLDKVEIDRYTYGDEYGEYGSDATSYDAGSYGSYGDTHEQAPDVYHQVTLSIRDLDEKDSGTYICEIDDARIEYTVQIPVPVENVVIRASRDAKGDVLKQSPGPVTFNSQIRGFVECALQGGYPEPHVRLQIVDIHGTNPIDLSDVVECEYNEVMFGMHVGMNEYHYLVECFTDNLYMDPIYHQGKVLCDGIAHENVTAVHAYMDIEVESAPIVDEEHCRSVVGAEPGDTSVQLHCRFRASPDIPKVTWIINTTTLHGNGDAADGLSTSLGGVGGVNTYDARLKIYNVTSQSFTHYQVQIENKFGTEQRWIELRQGYSKGSVRVPDVTLLLQMSTLLAFVLCS